MRLPVVLALALAALAGPAAAWEFSPTPVCTLSHDSETASVRVTYDPRRPEAYAIEVTRRGAVWPGGPVFAIHFDGPRPLTITTNRQALTDGGATLTVTDTGFGNVLDGLEFNHRAIASLGEAEEPFLLRGATRPVRDFRDCTTAPSA